MFNCTFVQRICQNWSFLFPFWVLFGSSHRMTPFSEKILSLKDPNFWVDVQAPLSLELQFPPIAIFYGQYNEPQNGKDELRSSEIELRLSGSVFLGWRWLSQSYPVTCKVECPPRPLLCLYNNQCSINSTYVNFILFKICMYRALLWKRNLLCEFLVALCTPFLSCGCPLGHILPTIIDLVYNSLGTKWWRSNKSDME